MKIIVVTLLSISILLLTKLYIQPVAIVIPHHNVVADTRLKMLKIIKSKRLITNTVIILSPDHFSGDQHSIYFSDKEWDFPSGKMYFDNNVGSVIAKNFKKDNYLVSSDHGIFNVATDVNIVWPNVKIVPILIGQKMSFNEMSTLISSINESCAKDCLLVASVDFSHYLPYRLANIHDENSIRSLTNMELENPNAIEVDSPQSIYTLIKFASLNNVNFFNLFAHTNSAQLVGSEDAESTSHVFGWYQRKLFNKDNRYDIKTFTYAKNIEKKFSLNSLGERFFFGTDDVKLKLTEGYRFSNGIELQNNMVVAGVETSRYTKIVFLPIKCVRKICVFAKGEEKNKLLQSVLGGVDNQGGEILINKN